MIVPMKKATLLMQAKDAGVVVKTLRSLGLLHIEHQQLPKGKSIAVLQDDLALLANAIGIAAAEEQRWQPVSERVKRVDDWKPCARHIIELQRRLEQLKEYSVTLIQAISEWEHWGDFDPESVRQLERKNIYVKLYQLPVKEIKKLPQTVTVQVLSKKAGMARCMLISRTLLEIPFKEVIPPKVGLGKMKARLAEGRRAMEVIRNELHGLSCHQATLLQAKKTIEKEFEFNEVLAGMGQEYEIKYVTGYIPYDKTDSLIHYAQNEHWGIWITEPSEDDKVPTLIRNPRWVSVISPMFKLIEVIPGYRELDISLWFLLFFSVFFGMLIGDAGIGVIFLLLTFYAQRRWARRLKSQSAFALFYLLSACAVIWGALTGTFFGQEWLLGRVKPLMPSLRNDANVQNLCFFIGALHLSIAHGWRFLIKLPALCALADAGWILILWGGFFLARLLILSEAFPGQAQWLFIAGAGMVVLFTNPQKNILRCLGAGIGNLLLNLVNSFTDVVSYIRLFAVGLATVAVADSFNAMAMGIGFNNFLSGLATALILILGQALNVLLGPMSVLVHGVRLNVLEFCSHLDIKWSGFAYRPLKE
ncbi:MAG: hypothetical protein C4540_00820 [Candidatus Omnitrophota bacterium]|jgi:V/A-type H+-transporting ATPase subunit I|nr:MAG: hypothetical protein C4540_00820 [Candidatus Omnitrophota bacterium]